MHTILCISHDQMLTDILLLVLKREGYHPYSASTVEALSSAQYKVPALILLDIDLWHTLPHLVLPAPDAVIVLMSTQEMDSRALTAMENGHIAGFICKPAMRLEKLKEIIADHLNLPTPCTK